MIFVNYISVLELNAVHNYAERKVKTLPERREKIQKLRITGMMSGRGTSVNK